MDLYIFHMMKGSSREKMCLFNRHCDLGNVPLDSILDEGCRWIMYNDRNVLEMIG